MINKHLKLDKTATNEEIVLVVNGLIQKTVTNSDKIEVLEDKRESHDTTQIRELHSMRDEILDKVTEIGDKQMSLYLENYANVMARQDTIESRLVALEQKPAQKALELQEHVKRRGLDNTIDFVSSHLLEFILMGLVGYFIFVTSGR